MKVIKLFFIIAIIISFTSCDAIKQVTNTTGGAVFSLNGKWQLNSYIPDNTLINSVVTVSAFISQGEITTLSNNTQCYREKDSKWKSIKADKVGGFTIENAIGNCTTGALIYMPGVISVVNNNEIKITSKNAAGNDTIETWIRIK